jgi:hypothetical protein
MRHSKEMQDFAGPINKEKTRVLSNWLKGPLVAVKPKPAKKQSISTAFFQPW